ncbi:MULTISPECIES: FoF1 ATP synthase subunit B' [unclassified Campylobacter]|uniref:FoF1 ATP synthase subunit B' n=1 Tax=unclassified Campylobacter TaxID=2593542 RepID=UPI003D349FDB
MLEINPSLVILTAVVFLGLIAILNPMLYKPMLKFIDERNASIKNDEESASKNVSDLSVYQAEAESIIQNARNEANKIRQEALNAAKGVALKEVEAKRSVLEADYNAFLSTLNAQKDELKASLSSKLPELKSVLNDKLVRI